MLQHLRSRVSDASTTPAARRRAHALRKLRQRRRWSIESLEQRIVLSAVPTSVIVNSSAGAAVYGQGVNLTADVSAAPSSPSEGDVAFFDNGALLATQPVNAGAAALDNVQLPAGTHLITASYSDAGGNFASSSTGVGPDSTIETVAGGALQNGMPALEASVSPRAVAVDSSGNLFIADSTLNVVFEVNHATGIITVVAGNGTAGFSGDGDPATEAELNQPYGVAVDASGDLFIADTANNRVREVNLATGVITTVAGNGTAGFSGDGGPATAAEVQLPQGIAVDSSGDLFIADENNNRVREVDHATGVITTVVGDGTSGSSGDGGPATTAELSYPDSIAFDSSDDLFVIADNRIREVDHATGFITTVAGNGTAGFSGDGGLATAAELNFPNGIAVDSSGNLFITDGNNERIREVDHATGVITTVAGNGTFGFSGDGGPATSAEFRGPSGVAADSSGELFIVDSTNNRIREVDLQTGIITTTAGNGTQAFSGDGGLPAAAEVDSPQNIAVDSLGDLFIADPWNNRIREVNQATGDITTVAGNGTRDVGGFRSFSGDGGPATAAALDNPQGIAFDTSGDLFFADSFNNRIREVNRVTGIITTVAGNGTFGFSGDGGPATAAELRYPDGIAFDSSGNLFIADWGNNRIREVNLKTGIITTVAGDGVAGFSGDGESATAAELSGPDGVAVDSSGNLFIADWGNDRIRKVNATTGIITTAAGNGIQGSTGDGGPATAAMLLFPTGVAVDSSGDLFIADASNNRIREVDDATGIITTVAGTGIAGFNGDGGAANTAELSTPQGVAVDSSGDLFIADSGNNRIREVLSGATVVDISPAPLTITADDQSKPFGAPLPALTAGYSGFVNGDSAASLTTPPTLATTATADSLAAGSPYPITVAGAVDPNYTISYVAGKLTVTNTPHEQYVTAVYADVLHRAPDATGLRYWAQLLDSGAAVGSVTTAIAHSAEYYANMVIKPGYLNLLGRAATEADVAFWTPQMQSGLTDRQLAASIAASDEFYADAGGGDKVWIEAIYQRLLGRAADAAGEAYWLGQLSAGVSRGEAALLIANSTENDTRLIVADYEHFLDRAPDAGDLSFWLRQLANGQTNEDLTAEITASPEFYHEHSG